MQLQEIDRVETISKEDFLTKYFKPQKPVVIERFVEDWPAVKKWDLDYMAEVAGDKEVPLYDHPDLADNMWTNPGEIPGNGIDDDGNGYVS